MQLYWLLIKVLLLLAIFLAKAGIFYRSQVRFTGYCLNITKTIVTTMACKPG